MDALNYNQITGRIKRTIWIMIIGLFLSGITAFPIETELKWLVGHAPAFPAFVAKWLQNVYQAVKATNSAYPFLSYGTDWLAFAHIMLAVLFIGPLKDPVKNVWVIEFGMIACIMIFPLAFIAGTIRGIPLFWRLIDCSFGVIGIIPLYICRRNIQLLQRLTSNNFNHAPAV
jgi:hypothetical protein